MQCCSYGSNSHLYAPNARVDTDTSALHGRHYSRLHPAELQCVHIRTREKRLSSRRQNFQSSRSDSPQYLAQRATETYCEIRPGIPHPLSIIHNHIDNEHMAQLGIPIKCRSKRITGTRRRLRPLTPSYRKDTTPFVLKRRRMDSHPNRISIQTKNWKAASIIKDDIRF